MKNLAVWSYVLENGSKIFKTDIFLMFLFNSQKRKEEKAHFAEGISKDEFGEVLGAICKCGSIHPFTEDKINWEISMKFENVSI